MSEYIYIWGNDKTTTGKFRMRWKGRICKLLVKGSMNSCLVEFVDNKEQLNCSLNALRKKR